MIKQADARITAAGFPEPVGGLHGVVRVDRGGQHALAERYGTAMLAELRQKIEHEDLKKLNGIESLAEAKQPCGSRA